MSVYLPDELAERVRQAKLPVSAICQAALLETLRQVQAATYASSEHAGTLPADLELVTPVVSHFVDAVNLGYDAARARGAGLVETEDLLQGIVDEDESLILQTLEAIGVGRAEIQSQLDGQHRSGPPLPPSTELRCSLRARRVVDQAQVAANRAGRPVNVAHLLLALMDDGGGGASRALRGAGLDMPAAQQAVAAMQSGLAFGRSATQEGAAARTQTLLSQIAGRLTRIEERLGLDD